MSDPMNPYGVGGVGGQGGYDQQGMYGAQPAYGSQPAYDAGQPAYGGQPGMPAYGQPQGVYGQPGYGNVGYSLNPAAERVRSNASMVRIMAFVSFVPLGPILSIGAWVWGGMLVTEARGLNAPMDVINDVEGAKKIAMICSIIQLVGTVLFILLFFVLPFIILAIADASSGY